ncbi:MAG: P27 family phage terminase small subunit [Bacteroidales bacterium]|nr:P27 family phage terminase small subunit [Bacteroidales bacterium]
MAGRKPKINVNQEVYHETKEHKEARENSTPIYQSQEFEPPEYLTEKELEVWNWLVKIFRGTVNCMVSDADVQLMELYCRAKVATDEADAELKKDNRAYVLVDSGMVDKDGQPKMQVKANPNLKKRHDNALLCLKFFDQLGLSPLARARAGVKGANAKQEENPFRELLNRTDD